MNGSVFVAITIPDEPLGIMQFLTVGRGSFLPYGAEWTGEGWWSREPSDTNIFSEISRAHPTATAWKVISFEDIPSDRTFRDALTHDGTTLTHDIGKARAIHLDHVRRARAPRLEQLDRDWMRATGQGDAAEAATVEADRQALRDLPATLGVETAATVEELKALWPSVLT